MLRICAERDSGCARTVAPDSYLCPAHGAELDGWLLALGWGPRLPEEGEAAAA